MQKFCRCWKKEIKQEIACQATPRKRYTVFSSINFCQFYLWLHNSCLTCWKQHYQTSLSKDLQQIYNLFNSPNSRAESKHQCQWTTMFGNWNKLKVLPVVIPTATALQDNVQVPANKREVIKSLLIYNIDLKRSTLFYWYNIGG